MKKSTVLLGLAIVAMAFTLPTTSGRTLDNSELNSVVGGWYQIGSGPGGGGSGGGEGGGPGGVGGVVVVMLNAECTTNNNTCNGTQATCGSATTIQACQGAQDLTIFSGNREFCATGDPVPQHSCEQGATYLCAQARQCTWVGGSCIVLTGGITADVNFPSSCKNL